MIRVARFSLVALLVAYAATVVATGAVAMWHREPLGWPLVWQVLAVNPVEFDSWPYYAFALATLAAEPAIVGWRKSSLRRLMVDPSASATTDTFYCAINASGLLTVLIAVAGFGLGMWLDVVLSDNIGAVIGIDWPIWLALPGGFAVITFADYLQHRIQHSRLMWPLHKSHHSSTEFTVLSAFRVHPFDRLFQGLMSSASLALIGFTLETVLVLQIVFYFTNIFTHSNLTCLAALQRFGVVTPAGHRLHHSSEPRYHNCNFSGAWNVWDRLFGTYVAPPADIDQVAIGVEAPAGRHNTANPFREIALQTIDWLHILRIEARALTARRAPAKAPA